MKDNIRPLLIHTCDIERADVAINTSTIRDRRVAKYDVVHSSRKCLFDPAGTSFNINNQLAQVPIRRFTVYFVGGTDVTEGDRLKRTVSGATKYYNVEEVKDYSDQGMHIICQVVEKAYAMQAPS